ncbi:hypothetical protein BYT27DRAFT_7110753, partial [Phlegmacium glaucopus]
VERDYDSNTGLPLYLAYPSRSMIKIMSQEEFAAQSTAEIQASHAGHHLLVTGGPAAAFGFDEVGMETLASPSQVFAIHDSSVRVQGGNENVRQRTGTTAHLLDSHNSPKAVGKILNALDFPRPHFDDPSPLLASDVFSFRRNASRQDFAEDYPDAHMRWGLAATSDACSSFHIDSHGLATYISCVNEGGSKLWVLVGAKDNVGVSAFTNAKNAFDFHSDNALKPDKFPDLQFEALLLRPGMTLYMRPNTPHAVVTPTAAICHGGHYLTTSSLRQTCHGYLMTFTLSTLLTNAELTSKVQLLFRQMAFFFWDAFTHSARPPPTTRAHLPDVATFEGVLDLFSFCNILELSNVTHPGSYGLPGLGVSERLEMIRGHAASRAIVEWVITHYEFAQSKDLGKFYYDYLAYQTRSLVNSKRFAEKNGIFSSNGTPIATNLEKLIGKSFEPTHPFWDSWNKYCDEEQLDFAWPSSAERPTIRLRDLPLASKLRLLNPAVYPAT